MIFFLAMLLCGIGLTVYGIWEQKNVYSIQNYADAEVVGFQAYRTSNLAVNTMAAVSGMVIPVVQITLDDGTVRRVKLQNTAVMKSQLAKMPELDIGGRVQVTYFGSDPKRAFLTNHAMAQTPVKGSAALLIGIPAALLAIVVLGFFGYHSIIS